MNETALSLTVQVSEQEFRRFAIFDGFLLPKQWIKLVAFFMIMLALALANLLTGGTTLFWELLIISLLSLCAYLAQFAYAVSQQMKRFRLDPTQKAYTLTFSERGDSFTRVSGDQEPRQRRWDKLSGAYRRQTAIYLYTGKGQADILPLEALREGEAARLWMLAESHMSKERVHPQARGMLVK